MAARDDSNTSLTLLARLACSPPDQAAWCEFVDRYGPRILQWCRAWALQEADILDVSQAVLTKLLVQLGRFQYDPEGSLGLEIRKPSCTLWASHQEPQELRRCAPTPR
jgi:hypothetical protein